MKAPPDSGRAGAAHPGPTSEPATATAPVSALSVPDLPEGCDSLTAALAYAAAGWYVVPIRRGTKNPGSVLGKGWQAKSTRDPEQIVALWAGTDHGVALHVGRSGVVAFDLDHPERVPEVLAEAIRECSPPRQRTRRTGQRGHVLFRQPAGRTLGNSTGGLGKAFGEVRGVNGVLAVFPTEHPEPDGLYAWRTTGPVPVLPCAVATLLPDAGPATDAATDAAVAAFLAEHTEACRPGALAPALDRFAALVRSGSSRHEAAVETACWLAREAAAGYYPAREVFDALEAEFTKALDGDRPAAPEFASIVAWAVGQVTPEQVQAKRAALHPAETGEDAPEVEFLATPSPAPDEHEAFWRSTPRLRHVHDYARARLCCPYAALGVVLARLVTAAPPHVMLPPLVGSHASLNLFVALVGPSGAGKGAAEQAATDMLDVGSHVETATVGSGEGIAHLYAHREKGQVVRDREAVLFTVPEVDNLVALGARQGSTLMPQLRSAWSGEGLGFSYADPTKRLPIDRHTYRLGLVLGVQPGRAAPLLDDADGGTPQRFLWVPTLDPDAPDATPDAPEPLRLPYPMWPVPDRGRIVLPVPAVAEAAIRTARLARLRGEGDALDGHALLCRLKVAAALALLESRKAVQDEDWQRAGHLMAVSAATRSGVERHLATEAARTNLSRGKAEGARAAVAADTAAEVVVRRVAPRVLSRLRAAGGEQPWSDARKAMTSRDRAAFEDAVDSLVNSGQVALDRTDHGVRLRLTEASR